MKCLVFKINDFKMGIPIEYIERVFEVKRKIVSLPLVPNFVKGIINYQGRVVCVVDLGSLLSFEAQPAELVVISSKMRNVGYTLQDIEGFVSVADNELQGVDRFPLEKEKKEYIKFIAEPAGSEVISILNMEKIEEILKNYKNWSKYYEV